MPRGEGQTGHGHAQGQDQCAGTLSRRLELVKEVQLWIQYSVRLWMGGGTSVLSGSLKRDFAPRRVIWLCQPDLAPPLGLSLTGFDRAICPPALLASFSPRSGALPMATKPSLIVGAQNKNYVPRSPPLPAKGVSYGYRNACPGSRRNENRRISTGFNKVRTMPDRPTLHPPWGLI